MDKEAIDIIDMRHTLQQFDAAVGQDLCPLIKLRAALKESSYHICISQTACHYDCGVTIVVLEGIRVGACGMYRCQRANSRQMRSLTLIHSATI